MPRSFYLLDFKEIKRLGENLLMFTNSRSIDWWLAYAIPIAVALIAATLLKTGYEAAYATYTGPKAVDSALWNTILFVVMAVIIISLRLAMGNGARDPIAELLGSRTMLFVFASLIAFCSFGTWASTRDMIEIYGLFHGQRFGFETTLIIQAIICAISTVLFAGAIIARLNRD